MYIPKELMPAKHTDACIAMFIAALFTSQATKPDDIPIDTRIKKNMTSVHRTIIYDKEQNYVICMKMDGTGDNPAQ